MTLRVQFPEKVAFLFEPHPYKCIYGGRGKGASWSFARALLILARRRKLFVVCAREIQKSIKESVHKLIADQIDLLSDIQTDPRDQKYNQFYDVKQTEIEGENGSKFSFMGIRNNIQSIKSTEAIDIFAAFEATFVPKTSWEVVLPTVRRDPPFGPFGWGSEVWTEYNPELETDDTHDRFAINTPKANTEGWTAILTGRGWEIKDKLGKLKWVAPSKVSKQEALEQAAYHNSGVAVEMNYQDNPFFPSILRAQMEDMREKDQDDYRTVWLGKTRKTLDGAIFAKELSTAITDGRLSPHVKIDRTKPCIFSFDLGDSDLCAWWAWQQIGMEHNAVDYYGNSGFGIDHYLEEIERRKLKVKWILLPHDAAQAHQSARGNKLGNTIEKQVRAVYPDKVKLVPRVSVVNRINATRALFPRINISEGPTADGVQGLTHYQFGVDPNTKQRSKQPLHNWASNPADAFTYYPVWLREGSDNPKPQQEPHRISMHEHSQGWMG